MNFLKGLLIVIFMTIMTLKSFGCDYIQHDINNLKKDMLDSPFGVEMFEIDLNQLEAELSECLVEQSGFDFTQDEAKDE